LDAVLGSDDDLELGFEPDGTMSGFVADEATVIIKGINAIAGFWELNDRLPSAEEGAALVKRMVDPWGQEIRYQLVTRKSFSVTSDGPDRIWMSEYDIRAEVNVDSLTPDQQREVISNRATSDLLSWAHPPTTWLNRRALEEMDSGEDLEASYALTGNDVLNDDGEPIINLDPKFEHSVRWDIGGATVLAGASYFWFFTWLMLGTAILFVPVGYLYKPKTYLQEEGESASDAPPVGDA
jgi:POT family proton-dependent oligopeptide transporter